MFYIHPDDPFGIANPDLDFTLENALLAYSNGIFPWPQDAYPHLWCSPQKRAVFFLEDLKISKRDQRAFRNSDFSYRLNQETELVIELCSRVNRPQQSGTWMNADLKRLYQSLKKAGLLLSAECFLEGVLVGGFFGVSIGSYFCGESMFSLANNSSKFLFFHFVEGLRLCGVKWIDIQMLTTHFKKWGAKEIERAEFFSLQKELKLEKYLAGLSSSNQVFENGNLRALYTYFENIE